ncbi:hypothetical protein Tco_1354055 [Tanacetum coccineum]
MFVELIKKYDYSSEEEFEEDDNVVKGEELGVEYFDKFPTRIELDMYMRKQLEPREDPDNLRGISNFTRRIRGMLVCVGNFTYVLDFMIVEDISLAINPRLSQVVLRMRFVELSNMTYDLSLGIVKFTSGDDEIAYKMPIR